jgi:hypothetical protein
MTDHGSLMFSLEPLSRGTDWLLSPRLLSIIGNGTAQTTLKGHLVTNSAESPSCAGIVNDGTEGKPGGLAAEMGNDLARFKIASF